MDSFIILIQNEKSSEEMIKKEYHKLMLKHHPDVSKSKNNDLFIKLQNIYKNRNSIKNNFFCKREPYKKFKIETVMTQNAFCVCGTYFSIYNLDENTIECESCSLFIEIEI
ncbi:hypothetical protein GVAV_001266 [Gurleya vavrai]